MRGIGRWSSYRMAAIAAGLVIAGSVATVTASVGQDASPVLLGDIGCFDPGDRVERAAFRTLCDEVAEGEGFAAGVLRPAGTGPQNSGGTYCVPPEQLWLCLGVGQASANGS